MNRVSIAALLLAAGMGGVHAADFLEPEPIVVEDDVFDWTGLYAGVQAGFVTGTVQTDDYHCLLFPVDCGGLVGDRYYSEADISGFRGGGHLGYNQQFGTFVLGAESDINIGGASGDGPYYFYDSIAGETFPGDPDESISFDMLWEGSTRVKVGVALDRFMPYLTGGVAYGQADIDEVRTFGGGFNFHYSKVNLIGYTVGLGAAYAMTDDIILRGEARYTDFGDTTAAGVDEIAGDTHDIQITGPKQFSVEGGVSFKF